ncbi:DUF3152 domain-containing protein [Streptomyces sp. NPDC014864]|uniref:DUF3152 domain-containing protein n=1 Tax=Streptomyces sp. NPDC014864 TaxID=3364924 RepID=UPI0036FC9FD6
MGRHSRRGNAPKGGTAETTAGQIDRDGRVARDGGRDGRAEPDGRPGPGVSPGAVPGVRQAQGAVPSGVRQGSVPPPGPRPGPGPAPGQAHAAPRLPDGAPARGVPRLPDGAPARGVPHLPDGMPARGVSQARGGHPEQREAGGGWGELRGRDRGGRGGPGAGGGAGAATSSGVGTGAFLPRQRQAPPNGPRQAYIDAFDEVDVFAPRSRGNAHPVETVNSADAYASPAGREVGVAPRDGAASPTGEPEQAKGTKGRTFTGIAAAAVTTVLAVVVAGQVTDGHAGTGVRSQSATDGNGARAAGGAGAPAAPSVAPEAAALTYDQKMGTKYPLSPSFAGSGAFDTVPGGARAPGTGQKYTYRVDVEQGLGLDGQLFADAVQKTLNDDRSWAHHGARTFERVSSGKPDFVITLASPGTTAKWCAKSGLDTTEDNVSCDSASTERVMINAYRWAQGSATYGDKIHAYRQMLINHEVGHRLGHGHVSCGKDGALAPVMQQQTKFLDHDGIHCLPNPWPYPTS